jgi:hypothetical protein
MSEIESQRGNDRGREIRRRKSKKKKLTKVVGFTFL